jgi:hypothetical protein
VPPGMPVSVAGRHIALVAIQMPVSGHLNCVAGQGVVSPLPGQSAAAIAQVPSVHRTCEATGQDAPAMGPVVSPLPGQSAAAIAQVPSVHRTGEATGQDAPAMAPFPPGMLGSVGHIALVAIQLPSGHLIGLAVVQGAPATGQSLWDFACRRSGGEEGRRKEGGEERGVG